MTVGEKIRKARKQKGLTQKEFANLTGIAEITIRGYENNKFKPKIEQLEKISEILNISVNYLLGTTNVERWYHAGKTFFFGDIAMVLSGFECLDDTDRAQVISYIDFLLNNQKKYSAIDNQRSMFYELLTDEGSSENDVTSDMNNGGIEDGE